MQYHDSCAYSATKAHKINHSFQPNCEWTHADHPCFGRIPAVRTIQVWPFIRCVDITSTSALSIDRLVSIFMSMLQCVQVVGITLSSPCVTVHPPWRILHLGLLYFIVSVDLKAGKIVSRGNQTQDHMYAELAC